MTLFSGVIGLFALLGAGAALRLAFGGSGDYRPMVDQVFSRIRSRPVALDRRGVEGAAEHLYPGSSARPKVEPAAEVHERGGTVTKFRKRS